MAAGAPQQNNQPDFIRYYLQFPAVTRTFLTLIIFFSVSIQFGFIDRYTLYSSFWGSILRFFDAGWGIWFLMTLVMIYQQSSQVESYFSTADYTWMLLMTGAVVMTLSRLITPFGLFLRAIQAAIAYRWARLHPTSSVHVYVINVPALYYPWVFLALDFVVSGPIQAAVDFTGILGAHLHLFLTEEWPRQGGRRIDTPQWFKNLFPATRAGSQQTQTRAYGTVIPPRGGEERVVDGGQQGSTGIFGGGNGNFRGQGHRLG